jgi:hypothetical protein
MGSYLSVFKRSFFNFSLLNVQQYSIVELKPFIELDYIYIYMSNTAGVLYEAGTAYPSRAPVVTPGFLLGPCS